MLGASESSDGSIDEAYVFEALKERIDEWCHDRALCHNDEHTDEEKHDNDGQEEELLSLEHECPQLCDYFCHSLFVLLKVGLPVHMDDCEETCSIRPGSVSVVECAV